MWKIYLKEHGHEGDDCYRQIMEHLEQNSGWWNEDAIASLGFKYFLKGRREWVSYSPQTIGRKCRGLYEMGLIEKTHDLRGHSKYRYTGPTSPKIASRAAVEGKVEIRNGRPVFVLV